MFLPMENCPPPPCLGTALRKHHPLVLRHFFCATFFSPQNWGFHGCGGCRAAIQVCKTTFHVCYMAIHASGTQIEAHGTEFEYFQGHICFCTTSSIQDGVSQEEGFHVKTS